MSQDKKYLYIPIEVKVRELQGKILLASAAAARGYTVVMARKAELMAMLPSMPKGIFLGSWAQENFLETYTELKDLGFVIAVMDEEGLATFSDKMYRQFKLSDPVLEKIDLFFGWGEQQEKMVQENCTPKNFPKFYNTGNVRVDILRPEFRGLAQKECQSIQDRFGPFILINSSFSLGNHYNSADTYFVELKKNKIIQNQEDEDFLQAYRRLQENLIRAYLDAVPRLVQEFPEHNIVIRPHPSERHETWEKAAKGLDKVHVIHEGAVHPWLFESDAVIHHFCTTALEAYAAGTPSIAYRATKDEKIETLLPYRGSLEAATEEELVSALHGVISGGSQDLKTKRAEQAELLQTYMANSSGRYAYQGMVDAFDDCAILLHDNLPKAYFFKQNIYSIARCIKRFLMREKNNYVAHKCSSLELDEIQESVALIENVVEDIHNIDVRKLAEFTYEFTVKP